MHRFTLAEPLWVERANLAAPPAAPAPGEALKPPGAKRLLRPRQRRALQQQGQQSGGSGGPGLAYETATGKYTASRFLNVTLGNLVPQVRRAGLCGGLVGWLYVIVPPAQHVHT
jgi:hypothetical protein